MLNLNKVRKDLGIRNVSNRKPLPDIISESYDLLYECRKPKVRKLIEAHIEDINQNPTELTKLNNNLMTLKTLSENEGIDDNRIDVESATEVSLDPEMKEITDIKQEEPEPAETESREEKTEKAIEVSDSPLAEQFKRFSENSRSKLFVKNLGKCCGRMQEGKTSFNLQESIDLYKAANSMMTQMAIELEHNEAFKSTFNSCTRVLGEAVKSVLDSIRNGVTIDEHAMTVMKKFSSALREEAEEDIDNFIDWVEDEDETASEAEEASEEINDDVEADPVQAAEELLDDVAPEDVPAAVEEIIDASVESDETDEVPLEDQELTPEEEEDLKKYLALIRGVEEDSEEMEEPPTEEEIDAMESRVIYRRNKKALESKKVQAKHPRRKVSESKKESLSVKKKNRSKLNEDVDGFDEQEIKDDTDKVIQYIRDLFKKKGSDAWKDYTTNLIKRDIDSGRNTVDYIMAYYADIIVEKVFNRKYWYKDTARYLVRDPLLDELKELIKIYPNPYMQKDDIDYSKYRTLSKEECYGTDYAPLKNGKGPLAYEGKYGKLVVSGPSSEDGNYIDVFYGNGGPESIGFGNTDFSEDDIDGTMKVADRIIKSGILDKDPDLDIDQIANYLGDLNFFEN